MTRPSSVLATLLAIVLGWLCTAHAEVPPQTFGALRAARGDTLAARATSAAAVSMCRAGFGDGGAGPLPAMRIVSVSRLADGVDLAGDHRGLAPGDRQHLLATMLLLAGACGGLAPSLDDDWLEPDAADPSALR